jgi:SAM-dependent methyltransferase
MKRLLKRLVPTPVKRWARAVLRREIALVQPPPVREVVEVRELHEIVREGSAFGYDQALAAPYLAAVAVVSDPDAVDLAFPNFAPSEDAADGELAVPPRELWTVAEDFLGSGRRDADRMVEVLGEAGFTLAPGTRVLDFGCGPGRVLRWLPDHVDGWGVDLNADRIAWCQTALSPPFRFATCGTYPHLPFGDDTFDLVYAGSVFTHLAELADTWLLELLRLTAPGGMLYLTIHDQATVAFCRRKDPVSATRALTGYAQPAETEARVQAWFDRLGHDLEGFTFGRGYFAQVFYDRDALVRHWGRYAEVVAVVPEAFAEHQTAVVLRRRPDDRSWR